MTCLTPPSIGPSSDAQVWLASHGNRTIVVPFAVLAELRQIDRSECGDFPQLIVRIQSLAFLYQPSVSPMLTERFAHH